MKRNEFRAGPSSRVCGVILAVALVVGILAVAPSALAAPGDPTISTSPGLIPAFSSSMTNYVTQCGSSTTTPTAVAFSVSAPSGTSVSIDGATPRTGTFSGTASRAWNQGFQFSITSGGSTVAYHVRCLPGDFPPFTTSVTGATQAQYYIVAAYNANASPAVGYTIIVDSNGVPVWWLKSPAGNRVWVATLFADGNIGETTGNPSDPNAALGGLEVSLTGQTVASINSPDHPTNDIHEILRLASGNYIIVAYPKTSGVDLSSIGGPASTCIIDAEVEEVTPNGQVVWSWFASQHLSPTEINPWYQTKVAASTCTTPVDAWHLNSVDDQGGDFVSSFRLMNAVYRISKPINGGTGNVEWKLGGTPVSGESFTIVGDTANPAGGDGQHDARLYSDGSLSIFDNGSDGNGSPTHAPRAVRYSLDTGAMTATLMSQVSDPAITTPSFCCGSARWLPGGNVAIGYGFTKTEAEYDSSGNRVWALNGLFSYRSIPVLPGVLNADTLRAGMDFMYPVTPTFRADVGPQAGTSAQFNAVSGLSSSDVWAAGSFVQNGASRPLVQHLSGSVWQTLNPPIAGSSASLTAITALSGSDVWAAGSFVQNGAGNPLLEHWDGTSWHVIPGPRAGSSASITAMSVLNDTDVWLAGSYVQGSATRPFVEHWNGSTWSVLPAVNGGSSSQFTSMTALNDNDIWAAGSYVLNGVTRPFVEHWNGSAWTVLPAVKGGSSSQFTSMTALSDSNVWAAGQYTQGSTNWALLEHWNGTTWQVLPAPQAGTAATFTAMTALNATDVWAAGSYVQGGVSHPVIDRWNGSAWQVLTAPTTGSASAFNGMSVLSDTSVWAAGSYASAGTNFPLLEQYAPGRS
jgi:hypothetical protein